RPVDEISDIPNEGDTQPPTETVYLKSNGIQLGRGPSLVFVTNVSSQVVNGQTQIVDLVDVISDDGVTDYSKSPLLASFPVGQPGVYGGATAIAITPDENRGYVALRSGGKIAVFDPKALQQVDALADDTSDPRTLGLNQIGLPPGAQPFSLAIDKNGN